MKKSTKSLLLISGGIIITYFIKKAITKLKEEKQDTNYIPEFFEYNNKAGFNYNMNNALLGTQGWNTVDYLRTKEDMERSFNFTTAIDSIHLKRHLSYTEVNSCWNYIKFYNIEKTEQMADFIKNYLKLVSKAKKKNTKSKKKEQEKVFGSDLLKTNHFVLRNSDFVRYYYKDNDL